MGRIASLTGGGNTRPQPEPRLVSRRAAYRYLGGEWPERFGIHPIEGKRQRLYDRRAIDMALDRIAGLEVDESRESNVAVDPARATADLWFSERVDQLDDATLP